jgi:hypothetical protein
MGLSVCLSVCLSVSMDVCHASTAALGKPTDGRKLQNMYMISWKDLSLCGPPKAPPYKTFGMDDVKPISAFGGKSETRPSDAVGHIRTIV